jgi:DNA-binding transcriptional MerR regulator
MTEPSADALPDKLYYRIGEVARLVGVKPYVLRYWESAFKLVRPGKTAAQHRLYRRRDVELLLEIRHLLYTERYTIEGARRRMRERGRLAPVNAIEAEAVDVLATVHRELLELQRLLDAEPPAPEGDVVPQT